MRAISTIVFHRLKDAYRHASRIRNWIDASNV